MAAISEKDLDAVRKERDLSQGKVYLQCAEHGYTYGSKKPWNFQCKQCAYVNFLGLYMSVPPNRREEMLEALEEGVNHMVESAQRGELQKVIYGKHPEISVNGKKITE